MEPHKIKMDIVIITEPKLLSQEPFNIVPILLFWLN